MRTATLHAPAVQSIVQRGWRRRLLVITVDHLALVLSLLFGGLALLILLGTQILAWQWLLALAAVGIGFAIAGIRRRMLNAYQVAQVMDDHLALQDSLSTAWFLQTQGPGDAPIKSYQLERAEALAHSANLAVAFPFERSRSWLLTAVLFLLALGLFSARYLVTRELTLEHSFLPLAVTQVFENIRHAGNKIADKDATGNGHSSKNLPPGSFGEDAERRNQSAKPESNPKANPESAPGDASTKTDQAANPNAEQAKSTDGKSGDQKRNGAGDASNNPPVSDANKQSAGSGDPPDGKQQQASNGQHPESLMDRMREAMSSVMAKIKPSSNPQNSQSASQKNQEGQKGEDKANNQDQSGEGQKEAGKEQSAQEQSSGQQQGQGSAKSQAAQGKDAAQPSDKKGSDAQSGVGHSDGDKQVRAAEQAKAMGKLAEIIGKRSASLTGEMQIEPSGKQRLQTGYTHQQGQHADLGGEINRDEVPVEDQEYIRTYMELVRKKPAQTPANHP